MAILICKGICVTIPDGRLGRVRERTGDTCKVRVRRKTGKSHQFLEFRADELHSVECPKGWMSPAGYLHYLEVTLTKMRQRWAGGRGSGTAT